MQFLKTINRLEYLDYLIRTHSTGTPKVLAQKLQLSERQLFRLIEELKDAGFPISYSAQQHYCYECEVKLVITLQVDGKAIIGNRRLT